MYNSMYSMSMPYMSRNHIADQYYHYGPMKQQPMSYKSLQEALALIKQSVGNEREDELFYDYLISVAPSREEKEIIQSIRDDERKHNQMFRSMYQSLTGQPVMVKADVDFEKPKLYIDGIKRALFGELAAVERYRDIRAGLPDRYYRDMVFEILTDELKHASKYNYILNLDLRRMIEK